MSDVLFTSTPRRIVDTQIADTDQMWLYLWQDTDDKNECKFGEHWVFAGSDPELSCRKRIRDSLGVRKDRYNEGKIHIENLINVTEYAKSVSRYAQRKRMDDYVRDFIGFRKGSTGEVHSLSAYDMNLRVLKHLHKLGQPLPVAKLSTYQYNIAVEVIDIFKQASIIIADLCARFGKTIWSGAVAKEMDVDMIVVAACVKTVFSSFEKDFRSFEQFADYDHIDTQDADYQDQFKKSKKKKVVYLSLNEGSNRQSRMDFIFSRQGSKLFIIDEADFAAWTDKKAGPINEKITKKNVKTILMTGTNSDRAVTHYKNVTPISVTYPELLVQKKEVQNA